MGREAPRRFLRKIEPIYLFIFVILFLLMPLNGFSVDEPDYYQEWVKTLKEGNTKEKIYALHYTPASLDCCKFQKDPAALNLFLNALKDKDHRVREAAAASVSHIGRFSTTCCKETQIVPALIGALKDIHPRVREEAVRALAFSQDERAVDALISRIDDKDPWVRLNVTFALGEVGGVRAVGPLLKLLEDDSDWRYKFVQQECVISVRKIASSGATGTGQSMVKERLVAPPRETQIQQQSQRSPEVNTKIGGLDENISRRVISTFIRKSEDPFLKEEIIRSFVRFKAFETKEMLIKATEDSNDRIRRLALEGLSQLLSKAPRQVSSPLSVERIEDSILDIFLKSLKDPAVEGRAKSAEILGRFKDSRAITPLLESLHDSDQTVREKAITALGNFQDERILDGAIQLIINDSNLRDSAEKSFMSVAYKTYKERAYVYRSDGIRYSTKNLADKPRGTGYIELLIHPIAVNKLIEALNTSDPNVKVRVLGMIRWFEDSRVEGLLIKFMDDPSSQVSHQAISKLERLGGEKAVSRLIIALKGQDRSVHIDAAKTLGTLKDKRALGPLMEKLEDSNDNVRASALDALGNFDDPRISNLNIRFLSDKSLTVRKQAVMSIKKNPDQRAVEPLILLLSDQDRFISTEAAEILGVIKDQRAVGPLIDTMNGKFDKNREQDGDNALRRKATKALGAIGDKKAEPALTAALDDKEIKLSAIEALGEMKEKSAVPILIKYLSDNDLMVRRLAFAALKEIEDPVGLEAMKNLPPDQQRALDSAKIGSATPIISIVPRPAPPRDTSIRSGYDPMWVPRPGQQDDKQSSPKKEEIAIRVITIPQTKIDNLPEEKPQDIKPVLLKLKSKDSRIRREAADKLGDVGSQEATDHLIPLLRDKDDYVRQAAARTLGKLRDKKAVEPLIAGLKDPEVNVRAFSVWALGEIQDTRAILPLCNSLFDKEQKVEDHSFEALRKFPESVSRTTMVNTLIKNSKTESSAGVILSSLIRLEGKGVVLKALQDPERNDAKTLKNYINLMEANIYNVSDIATKALVDYPDRGMVISELSNYISVQTGTPTRFISLLGRLKDRRVLPILLDALNKRKDSYYRLTVIQAMEELGDKDSAEPLLQILVDDKESPGPRMAAARALGKLGDARAVEPLLQILKDERENKEVRRDAASALRTFRDKRAVDPLINILKNRNEDIWLRVAAASSLGDIGDQRAIEPLQDALKDPSDYIRNAAQTALRKIGSPQ